MIPADLLELLRCPQTRQPLALAGAEMLAAVNARTAGGEHGTLQAALVRADGTGALPDPRRHPGAARRTGHPSLILMLTEQDTPTISTGGVEGLPG